VTFLTPDQKEVGRRTFLKALAGTPAVVVLAGAAALKGPLRGGPVRLGFIGVGGQGRALLTNVDPAFGEVVALCDINPASLKSADGVLAKNQRPPARHYVEWRDMLEKENLEAIVMAPPLGAHADIAEGCLNAGKHVLCEKMMAWDIAGCERMQRASERNRRVLEIGYQRRYNPVYIAAYEGIVRPGVLGDVYHVRMVWHRNANWRRKGEPPSPDYDPSRWGYPTWEHLVNWRLYWRYSKGLWAELASHQVNAVNWFLGAHPASVIGSGGVHRFNDGREVQDHIYATFEYPRGLTATYSSIESNAFENRYEIFFGTKATLIVQNENEALLFEEGAGSRPTGVEIAARDSGPALDASETRPEGVGRGGVGAAVAPASPDTARPSATRQQISRFCSAVRVGTPLACGAEEAVHSARACILGNEAAQQRART
jgi:predicted dehydrogenase